MAKKRTRRAAATLPPLPRGLRMASPTDQRKHMASINNCVAALDYQRKTLRSNLSEARSGMDPKLLKLYKATLSDLDKAYALLSPVRCAGPYMSFELPLLLGYVQPAKRVKARKR